MEVTYELVPEDAWRYNLYYRRHKAPLRPAFLYSFIGLAGVVWAGVAWAIYDSWVKFQQMHWSLLLSLVVVPLFFSRFLPATKKRIVKVHSQKDGFLCEHSVGISPEWFSERTTVNDTKVAWTTIQSIEEDQGHYYFFLSKTNAHIVPKRAFSSAGAAQVFLDTARRYWDAARTRTPVSAAEAAVWPPAPRPGA